MQTPGGDFDMGGTTGAASDRSVLIWLAVSVLILGVGLLIAKKYKY